jgi:hypothetical protein
MVQPGGDRLPPPLDELTARLEAIAQLLAAGLLDDLPLDACAFGALGHVGKCQILVRALVPADGAA